MRFPTPFSNKHFCDIKRRSRTLLTLLAFVLPSALQAQNLPDAVTRALEAEHIPIDSTGTWIQAVDANKPLIAINPDQSFLPASTMKLVTTSAALALLGPDYHWLTGAYATGTQQGSVLHGDLYLRGSGDPALDLKSLWAFLRALRATGVRTITGNLVLDRSRFAKHPYSTAFEAGEFDDHPLDAYNAGPDALLLGYGTISIDLNAQRQGVAIQFSPPIAGVQITPPKLVRGTCRDGWEGRLDLRQDDNAIVFGGDYPATCRRKTWVIHPAMLEHNIVTGGAFRALWKELAGQLDGHVVSGTTPPDARLLAAWPSPDLGSVIRTMNKMSNNVMARQLFLSLSAEKTDTPATAAASAALVRQWLQSRGIDTREFVIDNGSGLSRAARVTPAMMGEMLLADYHSPIMPELIASMPIVGVDGTMRHRLTDSPVCGHAYIKTGTLDNTRAIAGYVMSKSGQTYVIVSLINDPRSENGRKAHDALLEWLYEHG